LCFFHALFLVIYIHPAPFQFIRSWAGEETKSYIGSLMKWFLRGAEAIELFVVYGIVLWCGDLPPATNISFVEHMRIPW
jgi:hypothetical protein